MRSHQMNSPMVESIEKIIIDDTSPLLNTQGMFYKEFQSDIRLLRYYTSVILQKVPTGVKGMNFLDKQVSDLLKNAIKHGNRFDKNKKVKVHFAFSEEEAHLIIEDQGTGFQEIERWNDFYKKRCECYINPNQEEMEKYMCFHSSVSDQEDQGMSLFEAIKYWNGGIAFNSKCNTIAVLKIYPRKNFGLVIE